MKTIPYNTGPTCAVLFPSKALGIVKVEDMQCFKGEKGNENFFNALETLDFPFSTHRSNKKYVARSGCSARILHKGMQPVQLQEMYQNATCMHSHQHFKENRKCNKKNKTKALPETNVIQQSHAFLNIQRDAL